MKNKLNSEEEVLREKLNQAEFHYQESDWAEVMETIKKPKPTAYSSLMKAVVGLILISGVAFLVNLYYQNSADEISTSSNQKEVLKSAQEENSTENSSAHEVKTEKKTFKTDVESTPKNENPSNTSKYQNTANQRKENKPIKQAQKSETLTEPKGNDEAHLNREQVQTVDQNTIDPKPENEVLSQALFINQSGKLCLNEKIKLSASPDLKEYPKYSYVWKINGNELKGEEIEYLVQQSGKLQISLELNKGGTVVRSANKTLFVEELPELDFKYEDQQDPFHDLEIQVEADQKHLDNYQWEVNDGEMYQKGQKAAFRFDHKGVYEIKLSHLTENGCITSKQKPIAVREDFEPYAPNAFTPNGDGNNDVFLIESFGLRDDEFEMSIFDASGARVFYSQSPEEGWNGKKNNKGSLLPKTTYIWKVKLKNEQGLERVFMGRVKMMDL